MPRQRLLLFTSKLGYQTRAFSDAAQKWNIDLLFVTDRCHQLDDPWEDHAIPVHFESPEVAAHEVLQIVRSGSPVDGILALGDRPSVAAAYVARGLGISYNHPAAVEACRSKLRMREVFREAGLPVPWFRSVSLHPAPEPALLGISYPCVLKPLSLSASQGVMRANTREEFIAAAARMQRLLETPEILSSREPNLDRMIVEGYIPGREVALEGLLTEGQLRTLAIFDKPDPLEGPYFEETMYITPSRLPEPQQRAIESCAANAARALGLSHGPVHAEFRINDDGVWPLEIAPRPIGGLCARALRFAPRAGSDSIGLEELLLRHALPMECGGLFTLPVLSQCEGSFEGPPHPVGNCPLIPGTSGVMMIPVPHSGILENVAGESAALATPHITELHITARFHDFIAAWPEGASYLGFLFARAETPAEVENALRLAHSKLQFTLTSRLPVQHPATRRIPAE